MEQAITRRCYCCNDTGIISSYLLRKYLPDRYGQYGVRSMSDSPVLCNYCDGIYELRQTARGREFVPRYPVEVLDRSVTMQQCRLIHQKEMQCNGQPKTPNEIRGMISALTSQLSARKSQSGALNQARQEWVDSPDIDRQDLLAEELGL
jgi:hypothetical protein